MKVAWLQSWGISSRLVMIAVVPAMIMLVAVNVSLYFTGQDEIKTDLQERGRLIAAALAQSSQYAVVSGNTSDLERTLGGVLSADRSIAYIEVMDAQRQVLGVAGTASAEQQFSAAEVPIKTQVLDVNLLDFTNEPHVSLGEEPRSTSQKGRTVGFVRVIMSPSPLLKAKRQRVYLGAAIALAAAIASGLIGLALAQRLRQPLSAVMAALRDIRQGVYDVRLDVQASGELGELQKTIVDMAKGLSVTHQDLENQVASRTSELQSAIELANEADAAKRRLIAHGNALVEEERRRIAAEIHDCLNGSLITVRLWAAAISSAAGENHAEIERIAKRISATVDELYASTRRIVKQLRPEVLDTLGLRGAVEEMVRNYDEVHPHCRFSFQAEPGFPNLPGLLAITAYRVAQEALSNVVKHSEATRASVSLDTNTATGRARITVTDNGKGFDTKARSTGIGLIGMRERVAAAAGEIYIASDGRSGTKITIELPVQA